MPDLWRIALFLAGVQARGPTPLLGTSLVRASHAAVKAPKYKVREIIIETEPERSCPNGYDQSGANCLALESVSVSYQCPTGWQLSDDGEWCIGYSVVAPERTCDIGTPGYESCINQNFAPKVMTCLENFSLTTDLKECVREIPHAPIEFCPRGSTHAGGKCTTVRTEMPNHRCPHDFIFKDGVCEHLMTTPVVHQCPPGYVSLGKEGRCEQSIEKNALTVCPPNFVHQGGDCVAERHQEPTFMCLKGQMLDSSRCMHERYASPQLACPAGLALNPVSQFCEARDVQAPMAECTKGTTFNPHTNQCGSANKLKQPNLACPPNYHFEGKSACVRHVQEWPVKVCPDGFELIGKENCQRQEFSSPEPRCPPGSKLKGKLCVSYDIIPPSVECPPGSVKNGKHCVVKAYAQPNPYCPPEFTIGLNHECIKLITELPTVACPPNTVQRADKTGILCMVSTDTPAKKTCPVTQIPAGDQCLERVSAPAKLECPPQYFEDLTSGKCFSADETGQRSFCPVDYKLVGTRCIKQEKVPLVPLCPPGYVLTQSPSGEDVCMKETLVNPLLICPFGYALEEGPNGPICVAKKLQYEFDEDLAPQQPEEAQLPLESAAPPTAAPEAEIEIVVNRPVVQKGLVLRNEPVTISGPASEVAKKQAILNAGGTLTELGVDVEYVPSVTRGNNNAALLAALAH